ncbi:MAG: hypothetical protein JO297_16075 [Nitrososphaeraceae archaeon]|nr:hypothetical protein [Nitrososphaeraceae archaeon]
MLLVVAIKMMTFPQLRSELEDAKKKRITRPAFLYYFSLSKPASDDPQVPTKIGGWGF